MAAGNSAAAPAADRRWLVLLRLAAAGEPATAAEGEVSARPPG
ncbi:MAG: hypothetical protein ACM3ML_08765 [Micromonosporaceae bacterium]